MAIAAAARMAMNPGVLSKIGKFLSPAFTNEAGKVTARSIAERLGPDVFFGGMAAMQTPGDAFDKGAAFVGSALGGSMGGAVASATGAKFGFGPNMITEFGGGYAGDMLGMMASDTASRLKDKAVGGEGLTGWERMNAEQQKAFEEQIRNDILTSYGLTTQGSREQYYGLDQGLGIGVV